MATVESAIVAKLNTIALLTGKVYPLNAKEGVTFPYCVYVVTADEEADSLGGWIGNYDKEIEINVIAGSYSAMKSVSSSVVAVLKELNAATYGGVTFQAVYIDSNQPEIYETEIGGYRKIINLKTSI